MENKKSVWQTLSAINVNEKTEKKNGLTYLSWAWAWSELKTYYPDAFYTIYENQHGWNYFTDGITGWVKTGVTVEGLEHIEYLPIMDYRNKSIPCANITSFDVNKAIQRSLTKAISRHGLGNYIYSGEDLPESENTDVKEIPQTPKLTLLTTELRDWNRIKARVEKGETITRKDLMKYYDISKVEKELETLNIF